ncbi:uncharacterized protein KY384_004679 [Bacidia gigantensis]|uniref:uncharacterized protein n=1 Tax=Bacidia gigantensis TaxID=2732470 RepID=UPI001D045E9B|nr:uncharacterized protein KY384_004679 [Bacidia gigantensis]KAG8530641.1 hypothetical protein KY384_004679 [Bacidia gigantensis]
MTSPAHKEKDVFIDIADEIVATSQDLLKTKHGAREKLLALSEQLKYSVEIQPTRFVCIQIAIDLNVFGILAENATTSVSLSQIVEQTGKDATLLSRILKHLAATGVIAENGANQYSATAFSSALVEPKYRDGIHFNLAVAAPAIHSIPQYLAQINFEHPNNIADGPFQLGHNTQKPLFGWLKENPERARQFNNYMNGYRQGKKSWCDADFYPVETRLNAESNPSSIAIVDVGGGFGHDLEELKSKHPTLSGKLVLQDLPPM